MLPTLVREAPDGGDWLHEIKYDGYRTQLHVSRSGSRAFTRHGHDWSHLYRLVLHEAERLTSDAIVDGEIIIPDEHGRPDFDALTAAIVNSPEHLIFYAFDLLAIGGRDLRQQPLGERRVLLTDVVGTHDPERRIQVSDAMVGGGPEFFELVCSMELEGIVSKKANSRYRSGRTKQWLKTKAFVESEFVVIGWDSGHSGPPVAFLAREADNGLEYAGSAFITLGGQDRQAFWGAMERFARVMPLLDFRRDDAFWVQPELRVRARHLRCSGMLRHATLLAVL